MTFYISLSYLLAAIGFILGLKFMAKPSKAKLGNYISSIAMALAIIISLYLYTDSEKNLGNAALVVLLLIFASFVGRFLSQKFAITQMPELISLFNAFGGLCAMIIGINEIFFRSSESIFLIDKVILLLGIVLGAASFTGSIIAYYKLSGKLKWKLNSRLYATFSVILMASLISVHFIFPSFLAFTWLGISLAGISLLYGVLFAVPIGGADMPVLISILNAVTGVATALSGIVFESSIMLLGGILVGSTGILLTIQMCKAMNRSLKAVLMGGGTNSKSQGVNGRNQQVQDISVAETSTLLAFSKKVAIIPGFGMAVAQAQKECFEMQKKLENYGAEVSYIIHPVAGRMPGHMNVLLAEANIEYEHIVEMDDINHRMNDFDVSIIIGANDVVNPSAEDDEESAIYGMPIIKAYNSKQVIVMKRSMASGYSGAVNTLFDRSNCRILFGDAKHSLTQILDELKKF